VMQLWICIASTIFMDMQLWMGSDAAVASTIFMDSLVTWCASAKAGSYMLCV